MPFFGIFRTAWWMASVMVIPTAYDSHRPGLESQSRKVWVPLAESVRIRVCRPRRRRYGGWRPVRGPRTQQLARAHEPLHRGGAAARQPQVGRLRPAHEPVVRGGEAAQGRDEAGHRGSGGDREAGQGSR